MQDSRIAQKWEDRGVEIGFKKSIEKGRPKWTLVGKIQAFQEMLKQPLTPEQELDALSETELAALLASLRQQSFARGS